MFDFHNLEVYKKSKSINKDILVLLRRKKNIDLVLRNQLKRASISSVINIAEGAGRFSKADKRNFYIISRGSIYECVSLLDILLDEANILDSEYLAFYDMYEEMSKMLFGLIRSLE
jgi:four helix bundle protein